MIQVYWCLSVILLADWFAKALLAENSLNFSKIQEIMTAATSNTLVVLMNKHTNTILIFILNHSRPQTELGG